MGAVTVFSRKSAIVVNLVPDKTEVAIFANKQLHRRMRLWVIENIYYKKNQSAADKITEQKYFKTAPWQLIVILVMSVCQKQVEQG